MRSSLLTALDARVVGTNFATTVSGDIDLESDSTRLEGTVVPPCILNALGGRIPLVREFLTVDNGGEEFGGDYPS